MKNNLNVNSREAALEKVLSLTAQFGDGARGLDKANEAETRVVIIDEVLKALGWLTKDFNPETSAGQGYIDYLLGVDNIPRVVVEAKRVGKTFGSPKQKLRETDYTLSYFKRAFGSALSTVLDQATNYAHEKQIDDVVLTNGAEWLLLQVIPPPGRAIDELRGFYFGNILSESSNFDLFWELLSKSSVITGSLEEHLSQLNTTPAVDSLTLRSEFGDLQWKNSESFQLLRLFYNRFFTQITDQGRRRMLEKCFATDAQLSQYQRDLKRALRDTAPSFLPGETQDISPGEGEVLLLDDSGDQAGRVILVTGSVGCGKTTLVTKVLVEAKRNKQKNLVILKIDLIDEVATPTHDASSTLWHHIEEAWRDTAPESYQLENLRKYFGKEISELRVEEYADVFKNDPDEFVRQEAEMLRELRKEPLTFFTKCWRYFHQKNIGIALIIDNVDRASEEYQKQVYAFSHRLSTRTGATVIVTMREATFYRGQVNGFLDVRSQETILHLQTPNLEQLLARRIEYVQQDMSKDHRASAWRKASNWEQFQRESINQAEVLKQTFLQSESGREILSILASISWHNVRQFLELLRRTHIQMSTNDLVWQENEVTAALMMYSQTGRSKPVLFNIYRPAFANYPCYYLKVRVILMLIYGLKSGESRRGISLDRILTFCRLYGYQTRWTNKAIEEMVKERYLECLEIPSSAEYTQNYMIKNGHTYRASPLAVVLIQQIMMQPVYLCLIGSDMPFHKPLSFERYRNALRSVLETLDDNEFERDAIDLLVEGSLGRVVATYLYEAYLIEQPSGQLIKNLPEVSATERMLNNIVKSLKDYAEVASDNTIQTASVPYQPSLFTQLDKDIQAAPIEEIPVPPGITKMRIGRSEQAPLILWALVALKNCGSKSSSGVEITRVINSYLVDDHNKKFPNNISRALRGPVLKAQPWLEIDELSDSKYKRFGLAEGWQDHWESIFGIPAPEVS